jgi:hypothetical protein
LLSLLAMPRPHLAGLTFDQILARVRRIPGIPAVAVAPLAAVVYRHLPLPRALQRRWDAAAAHLARLREALACTDDLRASMFIDRFFQRFYSPSGQHERFGPGSDRQPDRGQLVALAAAVLHDAGATPAEATGVVAKVLGAFAEGPRPGPASLARELARLRRRGRSARLRPADARVLEEILASPEDRRLPVPSRRR